jgi:hypothetical protein
MIGPKTSLEGHHSEMKLGKKRHQIRRQTVTDSPVNTEPNSGLSHSHQSEPTICLWVSNEQRCQTRRFNQVVRESPHSFHPLTEADH